MSVWHRVFGIMDVEPDPGALIEFLHGLGFPVITSRFHRDEQGWFTAELLLKEVEPLRLDRYLATEEGIRNELNTWAAWLETVMSNPNRDSLMQHLISTAQVFTFQVEIGEVLPVPDSGLERGDFSRIEKFSNGLCQFLARQTAGVYQVDERGFFAADGTLLVGEE